MLKIQLQLSIILQFPDYDKSRHNFAIAQFSSKDSAISHPRSARTPTLPPLPTSLARAFHPHPSLSLSLSLSLSRSSAILGLGFQQTFHPCSEEDSVLDETVAAAHTGILMVEIAKSQKNYTNLKVWLCLAWAPLPFQPWALLPLKPWALPYTSKFCVVTCCQCWSVITFLEASEVQVTYTF